jgi:hypothetical protein
VTRFVVFTKRYKGDKIKENEMDGACAIMGNINSYRDFVGKPEGKDYKENLGADERIILNWGLNRAQGRRLDLYG